MLASASGLAELHKTVLVGFMVAFPAVTLLILLSMIPKADAAQTAVFRTRKADLPADPLDLSPASRMQP